MDLFLGFLFHWFKYPCFLPVPYCFDYYSFVMYYETDLEFLEVKYNMKLWKILKLILKSIKETKYIEK